MNKSIKYCLFLNNKIFLVVFFGPLISTAGLSHKMSSYMLHSVPEPHLNSPKNIPWSILFNCKLHFIPFYLYLLIPE